MSIQDVASDLIGALQQRPGGTEPYDTSATVLRVDGDTVWVHIPGGAEETPVQRTVSASPGDTVQIRVGGGAAWITGNVSAPPTDDTTANQAAAESAEAKAMVKEVQGAVKASLEMQEDQIRAAVEAADGASQAASEAVQRVDGITFRVIGSDGTVSEIQINDQGQINLLGTVLAQKIMAEDIVATGSFQVDNGVWKLVQDTSGFSLETTARSEEYTWAPMAALTLNENGGGLAFDGALAGMQYYKTDSRNNRLTIMLDNSHGIFMYTNNGDTEVAITAGTVTVRNLVSENTVIPETDGYAGLGSPSKRWANVYTNAITLNGTDLATTLSGKAPTSHAVNANTYGLGTTGVYGHVKTVNNVTTSAHANGLALSAYQGKVLKDAIDELSTRTDSTITVASGWTATQKWCRKRAGIVEFYLEITGGTLASGWNTVGTLPSGYRPPAAFDDVVLNNGSTTDPATQMKVQADGSIRVYKVAATTNNLRLRAVFST